MAGVRGARSMAVRKKEGRLCEGEGEVLERWREHFDGVLNVESSFQDAVIEALPQEEVVD